MDPIQFGRQIGALVREQVAKALDAITPRVAALEETLASLPAPNDGQSVTVDDVRPLVAETVAEAVKALPVPKDGENGKSVTAEEVLPGLQEQLREAIAAIPAPQDGKSVSVEDVREAVLPALLGWLESKQAAWELDFERRAMDVLQRAADRIPKPRDGLDGVGFDDVEVIQDGERRACIRFVKGDQVKAFPIRLRGMIHRGLFSEQLSYEQDDTVSFGGSLWVAAKDDPEGKPGLSDGWKLAAKRGRDGKDYSK